MTIAVVVVGHLCRELGPVVDLLLLLLLLTFSLVISLFVAGLFLATPPVLLGQRLPDSGL